ncbi:uncharacterized protein ACB057_015139 [Neosynchiropus ocellatus]
MRNLCLLVLVGLATGLASGKLLVASQSSSLTVDDLYLEGHTSADLPIDDDDDGGDDEDYSGSGSGDGFVDAEETLRKVLNFSTTTPDKEVAPTHPTPTQSTSRPSEKDVAATPSESPDRVQDKEVPAVQSTTDGSKKKPVTPSMSPRESTTTVSVDISTANEVEDNSLDRWDNPKNTEKKKDVQKPEEDNEIMPSGAKRSFEDVTSESMWERTEVLAAVIACVVVGCVCAIFLLFILAYRMKKKDEGSYDLGDTKISSTAYQRAPTKEFYA